MTFIGNMVGIIIGIAIYDTFLEKPVNDFLEKLFNKE